jgi:cell division protein FtsB
LLVRILRPIAALAVLVALAAYATIMLRGPQGIRALEAKRAQIRALQEENANLSRTIEEKRQRIEKLLHDPGTQELEIRKRTKMQRAGDTQFVLPDAHNPG